MIKQIVANMLDDGQSNRAMSDFLESLYQEIKGKEFMEEKIQSREQFNDLVTASLKANTLLEKRNSIRC